MAGLFLILRNRITLLPFPVAFLSTAEFNSKPLFCLVKPLRTLLRFSSLPADGVLSSWTVFHPFLGIVHAVSLVSAPSLCLETNVLPSKSNPSSKPSFSP